MPAGPEVVVDLLSSDAAQVEPGQEVIIEDWGGERPITGVVRRIAPYGFTRVSAPGIEEQRVNVIVDIVAPREQWQSLGHGYRVEARIVLWESPDVPKVPLSALFRQGEEWAACKKENGTVGTRIVEIGPDDGIEAEVLSGLNEGDRIVRHPSGRVREGSAAVQRTTR